MNSANRQRSIVNHSRFNRGKMKNISRQSGWTFWSLLFTISVIVFFSYLGMQLVPVYSANENVKNAMSQSIEDVDLLSVTRTTIVRNMNQQLYLDGGHELLDYKNDLVLRRSRSTFTIETNYQREVPLFFNLSLMAKFNNVIERELARN